MSADLVWSVFGYGTVIAIFLLPLYFIGYQLRKIRCKESIEKAEKSDKFDIFFFDYQWAARGDYWKLYLFYILGCLLLGWLIGFSYYFSSR